MGGRPQRPVGDAVFPADDWGLLEVCHPEVVQYGMGVMAFCFVLALLSKPVMVILPFILLLIDFWPLNRLESSSRIQWARSQTSNMGKDSFIGIVRFVFMDRLSWSGSTQCDGIGNSTKLVDSLGGRKAIRFDGVDDYLVIADQRALRFAEEDSFSVSAWVHFDSPQGGWRGILTKSRDAQPWYGIWIEPAGKWVFGGSNQNMAGEKAREGWRHIAIVQEGDGDRRLYVDGALVKSGEAIDADGRGDLWIAAAKSTQEFFSGGIGEVMIFRRAISHGEVALLATGE